MKKLRFGATLHFLIATGLELIWGGERPKSFVFSIVNDESKTLTND